MIIHLEIDQFIREIEDKSVSLKGEAKGKATDKINLLNRIKQELRDQETFANNAINAASESSIQELRMYNDFRSLELENASLKKQINND